MFYGLSSWCKCFSPLKGGELILENNETLYEMHHLHLITLYLILISYKEMWTKSLEDYLFARMCKLVTRCSHWYIETDKVTYTGCVYSNIDWCLYRIDGECHDKWIQDTPKVWWHIGWKDIVLRKKKKQEIIWEKFDVLEELIQNG